MTEDSYMMIVVTSEAATVCSALGHIKGGRLERAADLLEGGLDRCVMCLDHMRKAAKPSDRESATNTLRAVRTYRRRNPRHSGPEMIASDLETREIVRKILEELEK